jgi:hypothetical protein
MGVKKEGSNPVDRMQYYQLIFHLINKKTTRIHLKKLPFDSHIDFFVPFDYILAMFSVNAPNLHTLAIENDRSVAADQIFSRIATPMLSLKVLKLPGFEFSERGVQDLLPLIPNVEVLHVSCQFQNDNTVLDLRFIHSWTSAKTVQFEQ